MCNTYYKNPGVLRAAAIREWEWFKTFGPNTDGIFTMDYALRVMTERYGINHKRYFNIIWGHIEELWLADLVAQVGREYAAKCYVKAGII